MESISFIFFYRSVNFFLTVDLICIQMDCLLNTYIFKIEIASNKKVNIETVGYFFKQNNLYITNAVPNTFVLFLVNSSLKYKYYKKHTYRRLSI